MALSAVGLQTHIWNNNAKSIALLMGFPFLLLLMTWAFLFFLSAGTPKMDAGDSAAYAFDHLTQVWHVVLIVAGVWFVISWFFHERMINRATGAKPVTRKEQPRIYNLLENLCISRGLPMPKLNIIDTPVLNAYASGINEKTYTITLTTGIIETLEEDELEAVIGHELTHIMNKDVRLLIISVIFVGMISFLAEMVWRSMIYGRHGRRRSDGRVMLIAGAVLAVGYLFAIVIRFALSRKREYLADAGAVELTKNPDAMVRALQKISGHAKMEEVPAEVHQMCIENPPGFFSLFATHPPIEARIEALQQFAGASIAPPTPQPQENGPWG